MVNNLKVKVSTGIPSVAAIDSYSFDPTVAYRAASHRLNILRGSRKYGNSHPNISL